MMIVFALGMSMPEPMMVVQTSTSTSRLTKRRHHLLEVVLCHLPMADGDARARHEAVDHGRRFPAMVCTRLCR
jgi:hypothetical protein